VKPLRITALGDPITIREGRVPGGGLGACHTGTGEILIDPDQPEVGKHVTLLHELLHLVDEQMRRCGITRRRIDHRWVESAAPNLLALLVFAGLYRGVSTKDLAAFMAKHMRAENPPRARKAAP
jgi:hypothetical protein